LGEGVFQTLNQQGRPTGEAYVQFKDEKDCKAALALDHHHIGHRYIEVYQSNEAERAKAQARSKPWSPVSQSSVVIRMRGLPFSSTEDDIRTFFSGVDLAGVHVMCDSLGRPSVHAFVELASEEIASQAMTYHKKLIGQRYIELFRSSVHELTTAVQQGPTRAMFGRDRFTQMVTANVADNSICVRMQGLPYSSTESDITRFFQEAGVTPVRIHRKHNGGEAYVEFATVQDARQAMTRHKANIGRRYIDLFRVSYQEMAEVVGLPTSRAYGYGASTYPAAALGLWQAPPQAYERDYRDYRDYRDTRDTYYRR